MADEEGCLEGNHHYQDLRALSLADLAYALAREASAIAEVLQSPDRAAAEQAMYANRAPDDERSSLWYLDLGVCAPSIALAVSGACPFISCNGGVYGSVHTADTPQVRFYLQDADLGQLMSWAAQAGAKIEVCEDALVLSGEEVEPLFRFAQVAAEALRISCK